LELELELARGSVLESVSAWVKGSDSAAAVVVSEGELETGPSSPSISQGSCARR
jgi:hypothetical protein